MNKTMDFHERKVLRRKAPLIGATLGFSCAAQKLYLEKNILNDANIAEVMVRQPELTTQELSLSRKSRSKLNLTSNNLCCRIVKACECCIRTCTSRYVIR